MDPEENRRQWAEQTGEFSPRYYAYYGPNETSEAIREVLDSAVGVDAPVLELGCSSGRHLAHLREHGYENLHGVEINDDAFDVMAETYPGLAEDGTFYHDAIESVVSEFDERRFGAVYSVETLQHIHPDDEWVFEDVARIVDDLVVTVECEGEADTGNEVEADGERDASAGVEVNYVREEIPLYYWDWNRVFTERGLAEVEFRDLGRDTLRAFRPRDGRER